MHKPLCVPQLHESNIVINLKFLLKIPSNFVFVSVSESPLHCKLSLVLCCGTLLAKPQVSRLRSYMDREGDKTLTDCLGAKKLRPPKPKGTKQGEKKNNPPAPRRLANHHRIACLDFTSLDTNLTATA